MSLNFVAVTGDHTEGDAVAKHSSIQQHVYSLCAREKDEVFLSAGSCPINTDCSTKLSQL